MRRYFSVFFVFMMILIFNIAYANTSINFKPDEGIVNIKYDTSDVTKIKIVVKEGTDQYIYNIHDNDEDFPLQLGNGTYTVGIYKQTSGNKYQKVTAVSKTITVNEDAVFLASVQNMNWNDEMKAIALAVELTDGLSSDREKFDAIYNYIIKSIVYDYKKASTVSSRYLPVIDTTLDEKKGICYDYSSLLASMLRSQGIKAKLIEGESTYTSVYHAWNEIYIGNGWIIIDTTVDAQLATRNMKYTIEKTETTHKRMKSF